MGRPFIIAATGAAALTFAGVWTATAPTPVVAAAEPNEPTEPVSSMAVEPSETVTPVTAQPYDIVGSRYRGGARPDDRSDDRDAVPTAARGTLSGDPVFYSGCREVRAAGAAPLNRGEPGYRSAMDGDDDGIACESYGG